MKRESRIIFCQKVQKAFNPVSSVAAVETLNSSLVPLLTSVCAFLHIPLCFEEQVTAYTWFDSMENIFWEIQSYKI